MLISTGSRELIVSMRYPNKAERAKKATPIAKSDKISLLKFSLCENANPESNLTL